MTEPAGTGRPSGIRVRRVDAASYYDALAPEYDLEVSWRKAYLDAVDDIVVELILERGAATILDVGCGPGSRLSALLARTGATGRGLDLSPAMVEAARDGGVGASVVDVSAEDLDDIDLGSADAVLALWNVLGHVPDEAGRVRALRRMAAIAGPDGAVVIDVNGRYDAREYGWPAVARNVLRDVLRVRGAGDFETSRRIGGEDLVTPIHLFSVAEVRRLLGLADLRAERVVHLDYGTGAPTGSPWSGQILVVAVGT